MAMKASYSQLDEEAPRKPSIDEEDCDNGTVRRLQKEDSQQSLDRQIEKDVEPEGVFEIRDFSSASSFEKLAHLLSMATKRWCLALAKEPITEAVSLEEDFTNGEFKYNIFFQYAPMDNHTAPTSPASMSNALIESQSPPERLGLHSFPSRAHQVVRWFGVQHFAILSMPGQEYIELNRARTLLSTLVLAAKSQSPPRNHPLSCFVPVNSGTRKRFIGEVVKIGVRTVYSSDVVLEVDPSLEHLEGLLKFFCKKLGVDPEQREQSLSLGARFTYFVADFERLPVDGGLRIPTSSCSRLAKPASSTSISGSHEFSARVRKQSTNSEEDESVDVSDNEHPEVEKDKNPEDVLDTLQLHVLWPSFPRHSFVDDAEVSELEPRAAPFWKLRLTCKKDLDDLPNMKKLKTLLSFRSEAKVVRSAEHSVQPLRPKNAADSLTVVFQELSESVFLPPQDQIDDYLGRCFCQPVCISQDDSGSTSSAFHQKLRGVARGTRLAAIAEFGSHMKCFKGTIMLWCQMLGLMRRQWDQLEDIRVEGSASPPTWREPSSGMRTEFFSTVNCLLQQKFEMLQRSFEARSSAESGCAALASTTLGSDQRAASVVAPQLVPPAIMTEDMVLQRSIHRENITDQMELAKFTCNGELHSDVAAFKAANQASGLDDFLAWRSDVEGLRNQVFPREWFEKCWEEATACPASTQLGVLFEPEREVMMALHYLENIEGSQLLLQLFRVLLSSIIEDLSDVEFVATSPHLCSLRDRVKTVAVDTFESCVSDAAAAVAGEQIEFPEEEALQALMVAVQDFEMSVHLAGSLHHKLPSVAPALIEDLLSKGEAAVTSFDDREVVVDLLERCHECSSEQFLPRPVIDCLPYCKEFIILLQPDTTTEGNGRHKASSCSTQRMYADIRQRHLRLAFGHSMRLV